MRAGTRKVDAGRGRPTSAKGAPRGRKVNLAPFLLRVPASRSQVPRPRHPCPAKLGYSHPGAKEGAWMGLEIFLIDFENVQPTGVGRLVPGTCRIMLFLGQNQNKVPVELTRALQP